MNKVDFELNLPGLNELMKSSAMQGHLSQAGQAVASAAGNEYASSVHTADYIAIANVYPDSLEAAIDNAENNTLLKALGSVGLHNKKGG
jgi:hypothetical protein